MKAVRNLGGETTGGWFETLRQPQPGSPAAFFDRDGTLIRNVPYLSDSNQVVLEPGAAEAVAGFRRRGFAIVVVTNQSGVARGLVSPAQYREVTERMLELLGTGMVDAVIACPFHPDGEAPWNVAGHPWRKPASGMIDAAVERLGLDRAGSVMLGDSLIDMETGLLAGLGQLVHVATGHGLRDRERVEQLGRAGTDATLTCVASLSALETVDLVS